MAKSIKIVREFERAVIFRFGSMRDEKASGPGVFVVIPFIDEYKG